MAAFFEFLRNITYYLVFMTVVGVIAPSGSYKKYIALVMGVILIGIILNPVTMLIGGDELPVTEIFGNIIPTSPHGADFDWQQDYLREVFHSRLTAQTSLLLSGNNFELVVAEWETAADFTYVRGLSLKVRAVAADTGPERVPFIRIEPVRIAPYQPFHPEETAEDPEEAEKIRAIKKLISDFYDIPTDNIHVEILKEQGHD